MTEKFLRRFPSGVTAKKLPPAQALSLMHLHHPRALALSPGRPLPTLRSHVCASLCHSAGAWCPVPGAGGKAGRSRGSSLNSMASVHYYTVRIFIWTAKLKTDFCQNCRSHKNDDTGWGLFLFLKKERLKTQPNRPHLRPLCVPILCLLALPIFSSGGSERLQPLLLSTAS